MKEKRKNKRQQISFTPPSIEEVRAYCKERGNTINAEAWHNHYVSNGWRVGRVPMKDWRAAVRTWESNAQKFFKGNGKASDIEAQIVQKREEIETNKRLLKGAIFKNEQGRIAELNNRIAEAEAAVSEMRGKL